MTRPGKTALFEQFVADGITYMFGNPGTVEQGFLDTLADFPELRYVLTLQETVAAGIADGYARGSGRPGLLQLHSGVGLGNGIGMLYQAHRGHSPVVCIAGEAGVRYDAMDAQMASDLVAMARPVTKWATRVTHPDSLLRVVRRAVKIAMTPPRGPVFVALPMDVLDAENDEPVIATSLPSTAVLPVPELVRRAAELLAGAERPMVLVGDGVAASGAQAELVAVAETLGADVWSVDSSEPNIPADHPLSRGLTGHMFGPASRAAVAGADAVLVVGTYLFPEVFPDLRSPVPDGVPVVHVDLDAYEIAKNHPVTLGLVADPRATLRALAGELTRARRPVQAERAAQRLARRRAERAERPATDLPGEGTVLAAFLEEVAGALPAPPIVFDEALTASPLVDRYLPGRAPGDSYLTRGGSLGVGIPGALGLKLAHPDRTVLGFTGDGGGMYTYQALWTAARHGIGAKLVVCNNHRYELLNRNIDEYWREGGITGRRHPDPFDISTPAIDFAGLATALGTRATRVSKAEEVPEAVEQLLADDEPFLVDLATDDLLPR